MNVKMKRPGPPNMYFSRDTSFNQNTGAGPAPTNALPPAGPLPVATSEAPDVPEIDEVDDEVDDENFADQLNALADIEDAHAGKTATATACVAAIQMTYQANAAWGAIGVRRSRGRGKTRKGHYRGPQGKGKCGAHFGTKWAKGKTRQRWSDT